MVSSSLLPWIVDNEKSPKVTRVPGHTLIPGPFLIHPAITVATMVLKGDMRGAGAGHAHHILPDIVTGKHRRAN